MLYLLHGSGDTEAGWVTIGRANFPSWTTRSPPVRLPMIVVMPYGRARQTSTLAPAPRPAQPPDPKAFENDLLHDVMPFAEKFYRISAKAR